MGWDVVMFGTLRVPEANLEEWLSSPVFLDELPWLEELAGGEPTHDTPEALLAHLADVPVAPHELFEVRRAGGTLEVTCFASEDVYRDTSQALAVLFASAAAWGGSGELTFLGYRSIQFGERVTVARTRATWRRLTRQEQVAAQRSKAFKALDVRIHARFDELVGRAAPTGRRQWAVNPFTGRRVLVPAGA